MTNQFNAYQKFFTPFVEGRIPGRLQKLYYNALAFLGLKIAKSRTREGYTLSYFSKTRTIYVEIWQKHDYDFDDFDFPKNSTIIDIGANQGLFSVYAARNGATVHAFEPVQENLCMLYRNIRENHMGSSINVHEFAVTGQAHETELFVGLNRGGDIISGSASIVNENRGGKKHSRRTAKGMPINELLNSCGVERCDFLKIDCEGGEYDIINNISSENLHRFDRIVLEFHHGGDDICNRLREDGFEILRQDNSECGLIKARLKL